MYRFIQYACLYMILSLSLLLSGPGPGSAAITPKLLSVTPVGNNVFEYTYSLTLESPSRMDPSGAVPDVDRTGPLGVPTGQYADYCTFIDVQGFIPGSVNAPYYHIGVFTRNTGPMGSEISVADDPAVPNITFYITSTIALTGPIPLGTVKIRSTSGTVKIGRFVSDVTGNAWEGNGDPRLNGLTQSGVAAVFMPAAPSVRINAGGPAYGSAGPGAFEADNYYDGGYTYTVTTPIGNTADPTPYQSLRFNFGSLRYTLPAASGAYTLRLHFAETYWTTAGKRAFNVSVNDSPVLTGFDVVAAAGGANRAVVREFPVSSINGAVRITLTAVTDCPIISAIELVPAP